ncbi:hypothetical protein ACERII_06075 [Evansella sp. AB-rgal1]|uniref:hypothetical protein n=1 Tax=Evansella sp. AB-rgal1 TaxID=3242696 RepID=UPI00359D21FE
MYQKRSICYCGSGKSRESCCKTGPEITLRMKQFANQKEREQMLSDLHISSQFQMRYKGHFEFYGKHFIAYKRKNPTEKCNGFLVIISSYFTDYLDEMDKCPSSWKTLTSAFWEELICTYYPHSIKITPNEKETDTFFTQLKMFVRWLDKQEHTCWYNIVTAYITEYKSVVYNCERLLNHLVTQQYPKFHQIDWDPMNDFEKIEMKFNQYKETVEGVFEVTGTLENTVAIANVETHKTYYVKGVPPSIVVSGMLLQGGIGRNWGQKYWDWCHTFSVFPNQAKNYLYPKVEPTGVK